MRTITRTSSSLRARTIHVQRACDGCGHSIGAPTITEMDIAVAGGRLPSVTGECWNCRPSSDVDVVVDKTIQAGVTAALALISEGDSFFAAFLKLWHVGETAALFLDTPTPAVVAA